MPSFSPTALNSGQVIGRHSSSRHRQGEHPVELCPSDRSTIWFVINESCCTLVIFESMGPRCMLPVTENDDEAVSVDEDED